MRIENKGTYYECLHCGANSAYIENGGKCECALKWQKISHSNKFAYQDLNNIDNILESKRHRR